MSLPTRRPVSVSLRRDLLAEAKALGVSVTQAAEAGLVAALKAERARRWQDRNAEAIAEYNRQVGAPVSALRQAVKA